MKTLSKVIMIQWYRMQAVEIPIVGNTAFIGDNGAGKSALLDAIQTVLTGANKNNLVLNRGSNEASSRKLWEYILGVMADPKDPELSSKIKPREKANCYLALNFHDMETNETTCVGLGFYASMADMADKVEGHFICPGLIGTKELFLEPGEHSRPIVLPWSRVKERLAKVCPATRFHHEPGKFTADFYGTMSAHAGSPNKYNGFSELLPGLGAFVLKPGTGDAVLSKFIRDVVEHVCDRATSRERQSYHVYHANKEPAGHPIVQLIPECELDSKLRHTPPAETIVLVGWCRSDDHRKWIVKEKLYNCRMDTTAGSLRLKPEIAGARYLLLHGEGAKAIPGLFRISSKGPRVISKEALKKREYPGEPQHDNYLIFDVEVATEFESFDWDYSKLDTRQENRKSAWPYAVTLAELLATRRPAK